MKPLLILLCFLTNPLWASSLDDLTWASLEDGIEITGCRPETEGEVQIPAEIDGVPVISIRAEAFYYRSNITKISIPESVKSIGESAFSRCSDLETINIPDGVLSIEETTFSGSGRLTRVTLGTGLTSIGRYAFYGCGNLNNLNLPSGLKIIEENAFQACRSLDSISLPQGLTRLGEGVFNDCRDLESIVIPDSVIQGPGSGAFYRCESLSSVDIGDGVTSIGAFCFQWCDNLTSVVIGTGVTSVGPSAFLGCSSLSSLTIEGDVSTIESFAFAMCSSLLSVSPGENLTSLGDSAFASCTSLVSVSLGDNLTAIGHAAFYGCANLTSIDLGDNLTSIGDRAFRRCSSLVSLDLGALVSFIGSEAFDLCSSLTEINVADSNRFYESIDGILFNETITELIHYPQAHPATRFDVPEGVVSLDFSFARNLRILAIPASVTNIRSIRRLYLSHFEVDPANPAYQSLDGVFFDHSLETLISYPGAKETSHYAIPESVRTIDEGAFSSSWNLESVSIPSGVTHIPDWAFQHCGSLKRVSLPAGLLSIGSYAFWECSRLSEVSIPDSVSAIGCEAFAYCHSLTSITIPEGVTNGDFNLCPAFGYCERLSHISTGRDYFGFFSFVGCHQLQSVTFGAKVDGVDPGPFHGGEEDFFEFPLLKDLIFDGPPPSSFVLPLISPEAKVYVWPEHAEAYGGEGALWNGLPVKLRSTSPRITSLSISETSARFSVSGGPGRTYQLRHSTDLQESTQVATPEPISTDSSGTVTFTIDRPAGKGFYILEEAP